MNLQTTNFVGLFQLAGEGNRAPWWLFWMLVVLVFLSVVVWLISKSMEEDQVTTEGSLPDRNPDLRMDEDLERTDVEAVAVPEVYMASEVEAPAAEVSAASVAVEESDVAVAGSPEEMISPQKVVDEPAPAPESYIAATEEMAEEAPPSEVSQPDNLTRIEGIGPKISQVMQSANIKTFAQMARTDAARLKEILQEAKVRLADPETWPEQAALAAAGDWEALDELQGELKGGRRVA